MFRFALKSTKSGRLLRSPSGRPLARTTSTTENKNASPSSSAQAKPKLLEIFIDDKRIEVEPGTTILEAAAMAGVEIPRFCYHERLSVAGNCRMCLVEVEKSIKPVASCAMPVTMPGMKVKTDSEFTKKAREGVMEFLLMNHPLDCPICDQGGECDLQDQSMAFGSDRSRLQVRLDTKRAVEDKNIGPIVKTIMTRCIHCTRCVRFMNEVAGCSELGTTGRGSDMQIGTYLENTVLKSELAGNIVDLCPVGALTSKPYAFTARPWELRRVDSVDVMDAVGSNIAVCTRSGDLMRILPRVCEEINEEWLTDKARYAPFDGLKNQRLTGPLMRPSRSSPLQPCDWEDALLSVGQSLNGTSGKNMEAIVGPMVDAETMVAIKDLFNTMGSESIYVHFDSSLDPSCSPSADNIDFRQNYLFNTTIPALEEGGVDFVLLIGTNPRFEASMVNTRLRKAWINNQINDIALIGPEDSDLLYDYDWLGDSVDVLNEIATGRHKIVEKLRKAKRPIVILGQQILKQAGETSIYNTVAGICQKYGTELNVLHSNASQVAALDLGLRPSTERKVDPTDGDSSLLWLIGVDDEAIEIPKNCFVIYQGHNGDICANMADVVLPGAAFTEKQGTMVNLEGRVQQTMAAITPPDMAREDWKIVRACSEMANHTLPYDTLLAIRERMEQVAPHLTRYTSHRIERPETLPKVKPTADISGGNSKLHPKMRNLLDYWQTDAISRSSPTMSKCVVAVKNVNKSK